MSQRPKVAVSVAAHGCQWHAPRLGFPSLHRRRCCDTLHTAFRRQRFTHAFDGPGARAPGGYRVTRLGPRRLGPGTRGRQDHKATGSQGSGGKGPRRMLPGTRLGDEEAWAMLLLRRRSTIATAAMARHRMQGCTRLVAAGLAVISGTLPHTVPLVHAAAPLCKPDPPLFAQHSISAAAQADGMCLPWMERVEGVCLPWTCGMCAPQTFNAQTLDGSGSW